jgi:hypothetical protein
VKKNKFLNTVSYLLRLGFIDTELSQTEVDYSSGIFYVILILEKNLIKVLSLGPATRINGGSGTVVILSKESSRKTTGRKENSPTLFSSHLIISMGCSWIS